MSKVKEKKQAEQVEKVDQADKILQEEETVRDQKESMEQVSMEEVISQKKVNILPNKKDSSIKGMAAMKKPKRKIRGKRAEYTVKECGLHAKKKFGVSSEVFFIATREAGKEDLDLITLKEGERILIDFMKREVK